MNTQAALQPSPPNLFRYATKELAQDAFICWLLHWADPKYASGHRRLHECAQSLIRQFYAAADQAPPESLEQVIVHRQDERIDIWIEILLPGRKYAVLIEDKLTTSAHSGQLSRYCETLRRRGFSEECLLCIFLKTHDQYDYSRVREEGFYQFTREMLLTTLRPFEDIPNAIFRDFVGWWEAVETATNSFKITPVKAWGGREWIGWVGFYKALTARCEIPHPWWGFVNNVAGGYWGFAFYWERDYAPYIQLRQKQAAFCIGEFITREEQAMAYSTWQPAALNLAREMQAPLHGARKKLGKNMTVAVVGVEYLKTYPNGLLDLDATVSFLVSFEDYYHALLRINPGVVPVRR